MIKEFLTEQLEALISRIGIYRFHNSWHKIPVISKFCCFIGRHDFEVWENSIDLKKNSVELECFYCGCKKTCIGSFKLNNHKSLN